MENWDKFCKKTILKIKKQRDFKEIYNLRVIPLDKEKISFENFQEIPVLEWCKKCGKGTICGRCSSAQNNYNLNKKRNIGTFERGLIILIKVPSKELAGEKAFKENLPAGTQRLVNSSLRIIKQELGKNGFKEFYLLGAGPCKLAYCYDKPCSLLEKGRCRYPDLANDILECSGVNVFKTIENVGDKVYYIDKNTDPKHVPYGSRVGLVLFR